MIGFAGTSAYGAGCLERLVRAGVPVGVVVTQPDRPAGRRQRLTAPPVAEAARALGLDVLQPERAAAARDELLARGVEAMAICAFGQLVRPPLLDDVPWLNLHPSLLPRWRGAAPIERALLAGDRETGVCVMRIVEELDAGPVAARVVVPVLDDDDAGALMERTLDVGAPLLADALGAAATGALALEPQAEAGVTYAEKILRADRLLDPARPARAERDRVRALAPHIGALIDLGDGPVTVWRASPDPAALATGEVRTDGGRLLVGFGDGALALDVVQAPGKRALPAADLLRGLRRPLGPASRLPA